MRRVQSAMPTAGLANPNAVGGACPPPKKGGVRMSDRPKPSWRPEEQRWGRIWCAEELVGMTESRKEGVRIARDSHQPRWPGDNPGLVRERTTPMAWPSARGYPPSHDPQTGSAIDYANKRYGGPLSRFAGQHPDVVQSRQAIVNAETATNQSMMFRHAGAMYY